MKFFVIQIFIITHIGKTQTNSLHKIMTAKEKEFYAVQRNDGKMTIKEGAEPNTCEETMFLKR